MTRAQTCEANVKLERLAFTGVFGEEQLVLKSSSLWMFVLKIKY